MYYLTMYDVLFTIGEDVENPGESVLTPLIAIKRPLNSWEVHSSVNGDELTIKNMYYLAQSFSCPE